MAWTSTDLSNVQDAIRNLIVTGGGAQILEVDGRKVTYYSLKDLRALEQEMKREINGGTNRIIKAGLRYV